jgi:hypothetical protein
MIDRAIECLAQYPAMSLMPWRSIAGRDASRRSLRSVNGGLDDVRDVFAGRYRRSTSSINSSRPRRSRSGRSIAPSNQRSCSTARVWVITP